MNQIEHRNLQKFLSSPKTCTTRELISTREYYQNYQKCILIEVLAINNVRTLEELNLVYDIKKHELYSSIQKKLELIDECIILNKRI